MKTSSVNTIRNELQFLNKTELIELCNYLVKFKKENKEYAHYLLFEKNSETQFIENIKNEIEQMFQDVNIYQVYFAKKTLRKILKFINNICKYSKETLTHLELHIFFCQKLKNIQLDWTKSAVLINLYKSELKKISLLVLKLHEDLQYDYKEKINELEITF